MSNITTFSGANLPSVKSLATALRAIETEVGLPQGVIIIKMDKMGHWVFGAEQTEIEKDSSWAINPFSFVHGYIAWGVGEPLGEKMVNVSQPLPELEPAPAGAPKGWETQVGFSMKCLTGEDAGMEARYTTTSVGGKKAVQALAIALANQVEKDPSKPVPIVELGKEYYTHTSYGRIFTPVFKIIDWASMDGDATKAEEAPAIEAPAEAEAAPARRRRG
jgi:hypothetical protein